MACCSACNSVLTREEQQWNTGVCNRCFNKNQEPLSVCGSCSVGLLWPEKKHGLCQRCMKGRDSRQLVAHLQCETSKRARRAGNFFDDLHPTGIACIVVDMQPLFYKGNSLESSYMNLLWPNQASVIDATEKYVHQQSLRAQQVYDMCFFVCWRMPSSRTEIPGQWQELLMRDGRIRVESAADCSVMPPLETFVQKGAHVCTKLVASGFSAQCSLSTQLEQYWAAQSHQSSASSSSVQRKTLVIMGIETDFCVLSTVLGAIDAGYRVLVIKDACGSPRRRAHSTTCDVVFAGAFRDFLRICSTQEFIAELRSRTVSITQRMK